MRQIPAHALQHGQGQGLGRGEEERSYHICETIVGAFILSGETEMESRHCCRNHLDVGEADPV